MEQIIFLNALVYGAWFLIALPLSHDLHRFFLKNDATSQGGDDAHDGRLIQNPACSIITPERPA